MDYHVPQLVSIVNLKAQNAFQIAILLLLFFSLHTAADPGRFGDPCRLRLKEHKIFLGVVEILLLK